MDLAKTEAMLFKGGSGTGSNLSTIRSSKELLAGGGTASGPVSFMRGFDSFAGVVKSGGKTRRAAKMVILNAEQRDAWLGGSNDTGLGAGVPLRHYPVAPFGIADDGPELIEPIGDA